MPEQQLLKPTEWSYCDYFWVSDTSISPALWPPGQELTLGRVTEDLKLKEEGPSGP